MKKGFTLAEILITLGIVGVVAALTLPGVVMSYQKKVYVAQLQRIYNQFVNGTKGIMSENGLDSLKEADSSLKKASTFLNKIVTVSRTGDVSSVMASSYKSLNSDKEISLSGKKEKVEKKVAAKKEAKATKSSLSCVVVDTGASICMTDINSDGYATVYVDLNGPSKPNVIGRDFYSFQLTPAGKVNSGYNKDWCKNAKDLNQASYCLGTVRGDNWTMDY